MPIYTASYFQPQHHNGRLVSISISEPKGFRSHKGLRFLAPPDDLHKDWEMWKKEAKSAGLPFPAQFHIDAYTERYRLNFMARIDEIRAYLNSFTEWQSETWLCWERPGGFCHRNLAIAYVKKYYPHLYGGQDVKPATWQWVEDNLGIKV